MEISEIRIVYYPKAGASSISIQEDTKGFEPSAPPTPSSSFSPAQRVSTADRLRSPAPSSPRSSSSPDEAPFPRYPSSSSSSTATTAKSSPINNTTNTAPSFSWGGKIFVGGILLQLWWEARKIKEMKRKEREAKNQPPTDPSAPSASQDPANASEISPAASDQILPVDPPAATPSSSSVRKANSLELWVSRQTKLNRSRLIQRKLERGLSRNERDAVLRLCIKSFVKKQQAREIIGATFQPTSALPLGDPKHDEVTVREVLAARLGGEVQVRDYTVVKSVLHSNTADTHEWVQESRLFLHARADPTRRVQMDIRTRIVETKDKKSNDAEGLILVENGPQDLLHELLFLLGRPRELESDRRVATYVDKVVMTFGPSVCLEFEFDGFRIS